MIENIIYLRVSSEKQDQKQQLSPILKKFNLKSGNYTIYQDKVSAYKESKHEKRLEFIELLGLIDRKEVKNIYVWDMDRIYRNYDRTKDFFSKCSQNNVNIFSVRQDFLNNFNTGDNTFNKVIKDMFISILGWIGEEESRKRSERIRKSIDTTSKKTKSLKGKVWGRKRKTNYNKIYELKNSDPTLSMNAIARELNISVSSVKNALVQINK